MIAYLSNYLLRDAGSEPWRWMLGVEAIPAFIYLLFVFFIPKSPRWLLSNAKEQEAEEVLGILYSESELEKHMTEIKELSRQKIQGEGIFKKKYRLPLILAFLIAFFNQMSGINAFLYYAPRIFEIAGLGVDIALLSSIGIGIVNLVFTLLGVFLIDRVGRKTLMLICSFGYIVSLTLVAAAFFLNWGGLWVPFFLFLFIAAHAIGQGTVIWVFISEIFPNHLRAFGQAFGSSTHWVLAAIIPSLVPVLFTRIGAGFVFGFFAFMMFLQLLFVVFMVPETKGKSLEDLAEELSLKANN